MATRSPERETVKGILIDEQRARQQTSLNLLALGLDPQQITVATELTLEQVQQLQQS